MHNKKNEEIPDDMPVALPVGYGHPEPLEAMIARLVHNQLAQSELHKAGAESFEEQDDFDIPDSEGELQSEHQMTTMEEEQPRELFSRAKQPVSDPDGVPEVAEQPPTDKPAKLAKKATKVAQAGVEVNGEQ